MRLAAHKPAASPCQTRPLAPLSVTRHRDADSKSQPASDPPEAAVIRDIAALSTAKDLIEYWGYPCEEHLVTTRDGFVLGVQRVAGGRGATTQYAAPRPHARRPLLLWHGLSISANVFLCNVRADANLALVLADAGFDVWLGNSRGGRASQAHASLSPVDAEFWDFAIDDLAALDLPATVDHILDHTGHSSLAYIGYSQGSAQAFAALAINEELNSKINAFVALAPAMKPMPIANSAVRSLLHAFDPTILYSIFGKSSFVPIAETLRNILPPSIYAAIIQASLTWLFDWRCDKFGPHERKHALYKHLFSETSVKLLVHWFQIIGKEKFLPYEESYHRPTNSANDSTRNRHNVNGIGSVPQLRSHSITKGSSHHQPNTTKTISYTETDDDHHYHRDKIHTTPNKTITNEWHTSLRDTRICPYPTKHISTNVHLFCGSLDNISDRDFLMKHLPSDTQMHVVEGYEHMDFIWAVDAKQRVWDKVIDIFGGPSTQEEF